MKFQELIKRSLRYTDHEGMEHYTNSHIRFDNGFGLSIQAGYYNYSSPRKSLASVYDYDEFEIAVLDTDGHFINPSEHGSEIQHWLHADAYFTDKFDDVCAYVPGKHIQRLLEFMMSISKVVESTSED